MKFRQMTIPDIARPRDAHASKNCNHQKIKYYNILEKFSQMHVPDMARPRDAHASKNFPFQFIM